MNSLPRRTSRGRRLGPLLMAGVLSLQLLVPPRGGAADNVLEWSVSPEARLMLHATVPPDSVVTLQTTAEVAGGWQDIGEVFLAPAGLVDLEVPYQSAAGGFYFRLKVEPVSVPVRETAGGLTLSVPRAVPFGLLLNAVGRATGQSLFPLDPACADPLRMVGPVTVSGVDPAELFLALGCPVWAPPPPGDDPARTNRLVLNTNGQTGPLSGPVGSGRVEDGFGGVAGRADPGVGPADPRLDPASPRGFDPAVPPGADEGGPAEARPDRIRADWLDPAADPPAPPRDPRAPPHPRTRPRLDPSPPDRTTGRSARWC